jgi:RHH-type transcriptional regulator, rel operon repressor / antitoxin RelB
MEVAISPDLASKVSRIAAEQGRTAEALVAEAVERLVDYDEWFVAEVEKGLAEADRGELIDHAEVLKTIRARYSH